MLLVSEFRRLFQPLTARTDQVDEQQNRSYRNCAIGDVERREGPRLMIDLDEIRYCTMNDAVVQIPERASQDQGKSQPRDGRRECALAAPQGRGDENQDKRRYANQDGAAHPGVAFGKESKRGPRIFRMNDAQPTGKDWNTVEHTHRMPDLDFGKPVGENNQ